MRRLRHALADLLLEVAERLDPGARAEQWANADVVEMLQCYAYPDAITEEQKLQRALVPPERALNLALHRAVREGWEARAGEAEGRET